MMRQRGLGGILPALIFLAALAGPLDGQDSKWPPMTPELIERIENLPRERVVVHEESNRRVLDLGPSSAGDVHLIDHWKPLLITLIGRSDNIDRQEAERRYDEAMELVGILTQAELDSAHGLLTAAAGEYTRPVAIATENLLAYYARLVMMPGHWKSDDWSRWQQRWAGTAAKDTLASDAEDEPALEDEERVALVGDWVATEESGMFASACITPRRIVLVWQEWATSPVRRYSLPIHRIEDVKIYAGPNDTGIAYLLSRDEEGRELLNIELRSEDPSLVRFELELVRDEE